MTDPRKTPRNVQIGAMCYASQHLHPREYGVLEVCLRLTKGGKNKLYFDGRAMARRFSGFSKSSMYRSIKALENAGWLLPLNGTGRKVHESSKRYKPSEFNVLTHEQWIAVYGTSECGDALPVPSTGMEPFPSTEMSSPTDGNVHSQKCEKPFPPAGHSSVFSSVRESSVNESSVKNNEHSFAVPDWVPHEAWSGFVEMRKSMRKPLTDRAKQLLIKHLNELRAEGHDPAEVLDQSTRNSWQGLFPLKQATITGTSRHTGFDQVNYRDGLKENEDGTFQL